TTSAFSHPTEMKTRPRYVDFCSGRRNGAVRRSLREDLPELFLLTPLIETAERCLKVPRITENLFQKSWLLGNGWRIRDSGILQNKCLQFISHFVQRTGNPSFPQPCLERGFSSRETGQNNGEPQQRPRRIL